MDDLQRQPEADDRDQVATRINRAHDAGRVGLADRDIRLGNVRSAQSMHELDLMSRELDQLEAALPPSTTHKPTDTPTDTPADTLGPTAGEPWSTFEPGVHAGGADPISVPSRTLFVTLAVLAAIALVVGGVATSASGPPRSSVRSRAPSLTICRARRHRGRPRPDRTPVRRPPGRRTH